VQLKVKESRAALHPSEVVVVVSTSDGMESLVVDKGSLSGEYLEIGQPLGQEDGRLLVELPRETYSGAWRVWVQQNDVTSKAA
jgi:hypothetical protein